MIVNYKVNGWEIITQRTHALLALQLAIHWKASERGKRWPELLVAIADHDDAQVEQERDDLLTPQGGPLDFRMRAFSLEHGLRTMEFAVSKSRYIALICSLHLDFIAGDPASQSAALRQFLLTQKSMRTVWKRQLKVSEEEVQQDYRLLEWCDALSLLICQRDNQPEERHIEISQGPDGKSYSMSQPAPGILTVTPWPFAAAQFEVNFERRELQQLKFRSCGQFKIVFLKAAITEKTWLIKKNPGNS
jgi:hypothetical protein